MSKVARFFKNFLAVIIYSVCAIVALGVFASSAYLLYTDRYTVYLVDKEVVIENGDSYKIELIPKNNKYFKPSNYVYASMNESIASVDDKGNVTGLSIGETQITVKYKNGLSENILKVVVKQKTYESNDGDIELSTEYSEENTEYIEPNIQYNEENTEYNEIYND